MASETVDKAVNKPVQNGPRAVDEAERLKAQRRRSVWLGLALFGFVLLIAITSALQLKENIQRTSNANIERVASE